MFIIKRPKRLKKSKSAEAQLVLDRLEGFLDTNTEEPVELICGLWSDQQKAITYQEIREAIKAGGFSASYFREWQQDYSRFVTEKLSTVWLDAMSAGAHFQPLLEGEHYELNTQTTGVLQWIAERGADFVTVSTDIQKDAIASLLTQKIRDSHTVPELARLIRPCIGLTETQATANIKYYDHMVKDLAEAHPRMDPKNVQAKARDAAMKYAERQHRQRAETIAQTELAFAYNRGADEGIRQAQGQGLIGAVKKVWSTSGDANVCEICAALDGVEVGMEEGFGYKGKNLFPGMKMLPPAHPRCACAVQYIEVSAPAQSQEGGEEADSLKDRAKSFYDMRARDKDPTRITDLEGEQGRKVSELIAKAPEAHKELINYYANDIVFAKTNAIGRIRTTDVGIFDNLKESSKDPRGAYTATFHESAHIIDRRLDRPSDRIGLSGLIEKDARAYVEREMAATGLSQDDVLKDLSWALRNGDVEEAHVIADLFSGVYGNKYKWPSKHDDEYWLMDPKRLGREGWAHFFSATALGQTRKINAIRYFFGESYEAQLKAVEEAAAWIM